MSLKLSHRHLKTRLEPDVFQLFYEEVRLSEYPIKTLLSIGFPVFTSQTQVETCVKSSADCVSGPKAWRYFHNQSSARIKYDVVRIHSILLRRRCLLVVTPIHHFNMLAARSASLPIYLTLDFNKLNWNWIRFFFFFFTSRQVQAVFQRDFTEVP